MSGWIHDSIVVVIATLMAFSKGQSPRVMTTNGEIEGYTETTDGVTVDIFLGIPFAAPPLGDLRFRAPQPAEKWTGVKETKAQPYSCSQLPDESYGRFEGVEMWNNNTEVSEDCLYLNMWVPRTNGTKPTMIWFFGGSFVYGSITLDVYDGRFLAAKELTIVASMQYRMSVLGFLYMANDDAPGNMGLLDQQLAMKWIYDNVNVFGGNQEKITLFGESSGAASINHHMFAPSSWPYFSNVILLSASSLAHWAYDAPENVFELTRAFIKEVNCDDIEHSKVMECLRNKDASYLELMQWNLATKTIGVFVPTIDGTFLPNYPNKLLLSGSIKPANMLMGVTKDEGEFFMLYFYPEYFPADSIWSPSPLSKSAYLDMLCRIPGCTNDLQQRGTLYTYEMSKLPSKRGIYRDTIDEVLGDFYFKCPVREMAIEHSNVGNAQTYVYSFEYRHSANPWPTWMGALHGYEIEMMFGMPFNPQRNYSDLDRVVSTNVMKYIVGFARDGDLRSYEQSWPAFTTDSEQHIVFSQDGSTHVREGLRTKECTFWNYLMPQLKTHSGGTTNGGANLKELSSRFVWLTMIASMLLKTL
ncbi:hypothetical protein ACF0H5_010982 [Mactra antiquata]